MIARPVAIDAGCAALILSALTFCAHADERYPTVKQIEEGLSHRSDFRGRVAAGAQLPFTIPALGRGWNVYYLHGRQLGNGDYEVRIRLR